MATKLVSLILEPTFLKLLIHLIKYLLTLWGQDAKHRREHRLPMPTSSNTASVHANVNTYGLFNLNTSPDESHRTNTTSGAVIMTEKEKKKDDDDFTIAGTLIGLIVPILACLGLGVLIAIGLIALLCLIIWVFGEPVKKTEKQDEIIEEAWKREKERVLGTNYCEPPRRQDDNDSTELKLGILASLRPDVHRDVLLEVLLAHEGSVDTAFSSLNTPDAF